MKSFSLSCALSLLFSASFASSAFAVSVGKPAPDFTATGSDGKTYHLADLLAKPEHPFIVLEWHNQGCPFVKKFYNNGIGSGSMQALQKEWTGKGVLWFSVLSSAAGKEGNISASAENKYLTEKDAHPTAALLDANGKIGNLYGAKTTPHMFVIDPKGTLIYNGAIDDKASTDPADIAGAKNYVSAALTEAMANPPRPVSVSSTRPYGCSVKY